jgi:ABC-type multidrug transport system permease subunit
MLGRLRDFYRFPDLVAITLIVPLLLGVVLAFALKEQGPGPLGVVVVTAPGEEDAAAKVRALLETEAGLRVWAASPAEAAQDMGSGKALLAIVPGAPPTYRFDPTRVEARLARELADGALQRGSGRRDLVSARAELRTEPGTRYIDFVFPGLLGAAVMNNALYGVGFMLVDQRMKKMLKRLRGTPMRPLDFFIASVLFRKLHLIPEAAITLVGANLLFGVPVRGPIWLLGLVIFMGSLAFSGLGLLAASRTRSTHTASGFINIITIPMLLCSGVFFSAERFPETVQPLLKGLPLTAMLDSSRAVMFDGAGFGQVLGPLAVLLAWSVGCFFTALWLFRWD